jgi:hypothetical protein
VLRSFRQATQDAEAQMRSHELELNVEITFEEILADLLYPGGS